MCSNEETVLSDVHMTSHHNAVIIESNFSQRLVGLKVAQTRFEVKALGKPDYSEEGNVSQPVQTASALPETTGSSFLQDNVPAAFDEDGDLVYLNKGDYSKDVIYIDHCMATPLPLVGLQVWQGSLILADYFLHCGSRVLKNCRLIELGAGTGFCGLVAAIFADTVILTDYDEDVLELCQRNLSQNSQLLNAKTQVRKLDWCERIGDQTSVDPRWKLEYKDLQCAQLNTVIAADVVYKDDLTDALFSTINTLMEGTVKLFYLGLEKRLNFTLEDLDVACPAYNYFLTCVQKHNFIADKVDTNFPQYLNYNRTPQLELWILRKKT